MKKVALVLISLLCLAGGAMAQQKVAVLDVKVSGGNVTPMNKMLVRAAMENAVANTDGYIAINRTALDRIMEEHNFQRSGNVSDEEIQKLGQMAGANYVLALEAMEEGNQIAVTANVLNIETGVYGGSDFELLTATNDEIKEGCKRLASRLFKASSAKVNKPATPTGFVDLGLTSGIKWKKYNSGMYSYDEAVSKFGNSLPSQEQWEELKAECQWTWTGSGYKVTGPNGNSIDLPAAGYRNCNGSTYYVGSYGRYWSSTPNGSGEAWYLYFNSSSVDMGSNDRCGGGSVRLVQD